MAENTNITKLDWTQAVARCVDPDNDALRIEVPEAAGISIELSAEDGDSVQTYAGNTIATVNLTSGNTGTDTEIIAPVSASGYNKIAVYVTSSTDVAVPPNVIVQYSPATGGDVWVSSSVTATMSGSSGTTIMGVVDDKAVAMRARVLITAALTGSEAGVAYLLMSN